MYLTVKHPNGTDIKRGTYHLHISDEFVFINYIDKNNVMQVYHVEDMVRAGIIFNIHIGE